MDLHDVYEQARRILAQPRARHRCFCGYKTDLIEVMAIHAVRAHDWPIDQTGDNWLIERDRSRDHLFNPPRVAYLARSCFPGGSIAGAVIDSATFDFYEADDPSGPWTKCVDGIVRKRYATMRVRG